MILKPPAERNPFEWQMCAKAKPYLEIGDEDAAKPLKGDAEDEYDALKAELAQFDDIKPGELPEGIGHGAISAATRRRRTSWRSGVYDAPKEEVQPGFLTLLDPGDREDRPAARSESTGRRTALANWLTDPDNPLTARVMVNRIWHYHFGKGIVGTPSDFGVMGERPTHPELLDWLAARIRPQRLEHEAHAPADHDLGDVSAVVAIPQGRGRRSIRTTGCCGRSRGSGWKAK